MERSIDGDAGGRWMRMRMASVDMEVYGMDMDKMAWMDMEDAHMAWMAYMEYMGYDHTSVDAMDIEDVQEWASREIIACDDMGIYDGISEIMEEWVRE